MTVKNELSRLQLDTPTVIDGNRCHIYAVARALGITVTITSLAGKLTVTKTSNQPRDIPTTGYQQRFIEWLQSLPYDTQTRIPVTLTYPEAYIRTCISRSGLDVIFTDGSITRRTAALRKYQGKVALRIHDEIITVFDAPKPCYLTLAQRQYCDTLLTHLGLTYGDVR